MRKTLSERVQRALTGFAAGVMVAASVWSLLIPAIEESSAMGKWSFVPAAAGFWIGILFLLALDHIIPHLHAKSGQTEGPRSRLQRTTMMVLAVTLHNIPEGMAVGVVYAGYLSGSAQITAAGALALSLGIAIQNFPEGAIISMPLRAEGMKKGRAFAGGVLSGIVEPIGAVLTILAARLIVPALPYLLSFAAGAMLYVVVEELIPEMSQGEHSNLGTVFFAVGFSVMMVQDVALGEIESKMHGCRRRPRTLYNIRRSTRSFAARSARSVGVQKRAHRNLPATSKRKKSCIKARNCLQTTDISCIVAVETAGCTFCGENFRICHPMNSSRSMLLQASAQEKGKTTRPELCA